MMLDMLYLDGYGIYVYTAIGVAVLPMSAYACWVYRYYRRARQHRHD